MINWNDNKPWYHGSPSKLTSLKIGSTITQNRRLATIFSHKPSLVSIVDDVDDVDDADDADTDDSDDIKIKHNGAQPGFLYTISEPLQADDVMPHPHSTMADGLEWLTKRVLAVTLIGPTQIEETERLTEVELAELKQRLNEMK